MDSYNFFRYFLRVCLKKKQPSLHFSVSLTGDFRLKQWTHITATWRQHQSCCDWSIYRSAPYWAESSSPSIRSASFHSGQPASDGNRIWRGYGLLVQYSHPLSDGNIWGGSAICHFLSFSIFSVFHPHIFFLSLSFFCLSFFPFFFSFTRKQIKTQTAPSLASSVHRLSPHQMEFKAPEENQEGTSGGSDCCNISVVVQIVNHPLHHINGSKMFLMLRTKTHGSFLKQ